MRIRKGGQTNVICVASGPQPSDQPSPQQLLTGSLHERKSRSCLNSEKEKKQSVSAWRGVRCLSARSTCSKSWSSGNWASGKPASSSATCTSFSRSTTGRRSGSTLRSKSSTGTAKRWSGYSCGISQVRAKRLFSPTARLKVRPGRFGAN